MLSKIVGLILLIILSACVQEEPKETAKPTDVQPSNFTQTRMANCRLRWDVRLENPLRDETVYKLSMPADDLADITPGEIQLIAYPEEGAVVDKTYRGMKVRVVNASDAIFDVPTIDFWVYMVQEARDSNGNWQLVETLKRGDCYYSYFTVSLPPDCYWEFEAPRYEGTFETDLRFALFLGEEKWLCSEPFRGSVNPAQFAGQRSDSLHWRNTGVPYSLPPADSEH